MRVVAFPMYVLPQMREDMGALWQALAQQLDGRDLPAAPQFDDPLAQGLPDNLLMVQYCGFPYVSLWRGQLRPLASLHYDAPHCDGIWHRSVVVVHKNSAYEKLEHLRGREAAINGYDSNTGMNLLRHAIAPLAGGKHFLGGVTETGAHVESMRAVADGQADVAAIDCVTFAYIRDYLPELWAQVRVIAVTAASPALPLFTRADAPEAIRNALLQAWRAVLSDTAYAALLKRLRMKGISPVDDGQLQVIADYQAEAEQAGYPVLR